LETRAGQLAIARRQADIADQQARLAHVRLRHDLYDRRYKIYEAARALVIAVFTRVNVTDEEIYAFTTGTADAVFLLNSDIVAYFEDMRNRAWRLQQP
jgi:hypothetical protein